MTLLADLPFGCGQKCSLNLTINNVHFQEYPNILSVSINFVMIPEHGADQLQTVDSVTHFLIFKGHCVALKAAHAWS